MTFYNQSINQAATRVLVILQAWMAVACGGSLIIFPLPVSDGLLISGRNVSYLGLHTSFTENKNKTSCTVSGENGRHALFFFFFFFPTGLFGSIRPNCRQAGSSDGCNKTLSKSPAVPSAAASDLSCLIRTKLRTSENEGEKKKILVAMMAD